MCASRTVPDRPRGISRVIYRHSGQARALGKPGESLRSCVAPVRGMAATGAPYASRVAYRGAGRLAGRS
jgi:hypothetical protein